jgi:nucleoid-associated protein YgaU
VFLQKAYFVNLETQQRMPVQFNPTELNFNKTAQLAEISIPGLDQPVLQFIRGGTETVSVELFFDTTDQGMGDSVMSVTERVNQFYLMVKQDPDTHAAPRCCMYWGAPPGGEDQGKNPVSYAPYYFNCIVESIDRKFTVFSPDGTPLRARLTLKLREYKTVEQMVAQLNSADRTKTHVVKRRERLDQIAARAYDTSAEWRRIAEANDLEDPRRVPPGTILQVPPMRPESVTRRKS